MSSSSSSSSSANPSPSSSSSSSGCTDHCLWEPIVDGFGNVIGWSKLCHGCNDTSFCPQPGDTAPKAAMGVRTECYEFNQFTAEAVQKSERSGSLSEGFVRVQVVEDPASWSTSLISLNDQLTMFSDSGWTIVFFRVANGPDEATVTPSTLPTDSFNFNDKVLSAYVVLPESGGPNQYWVPVTERVGLFGYRVALLQTPEWSVIFLRQPAPGPCQ